ncbi:MAG: hypothetical protein R6W70_02695 [bacterium]
MSEKNKNKTLCKIVENNDKEAFRAYCESVFSRRSVFEKLMRIDSRFYRKCFFISTLLLVFASIFISWIFYRALVAERLRPPPVIYYNQEGTPVIFKNTEAEKCLPDVRIKSFLSRFINSYSGTSPSKEKDMVDAMNMMTPLFRKVNMTQKETKKKQALKIQHNTETFGRQLYTTVKITAKKIEIIESEQKSRNYSADSECSVESGDVLAIMGTAELSWKNIHKPDEVLQTTYILFNASLVYTGISEYTPSGLLVDDFGTISVESRKELELLLERSDVQF